MGVQRAGKSWLYECLKEHNEVFIPRKEVHFFDKQHEKGIDWYYSLFDIKDGSKIAGEFTPDYLIDELAIQEISKTCPDLKIIVILRDPFDRAYSAYNLFVAHGRFKRLTL